MATRYDRIPGVSANYLDGTFASLSDITGSQPTVLIAAEAEKGQSVVPFLATSLDQVATEFGTDARLTKLAGQIAGSGSNLVLSRVGGKQSHFILERPIADSSEKEIVLRISPVQKVANDSDYMDDLKVALLPFEDSGIIRQRVLIFDKDSEVAIYDSEDLLSSDDSLFEVEINNDIGEIFMSLNTKGNDAANAPDTIAAALTDVEMSAIAKADALNSLDISDLASLKDFCAEASTFSNFAHYTGAMTTPVIASSTSVVTKDLINGDNSSLSVNERFASVQGLYSEMEYSGVDYVYCDGCFADQKSISIDASDTTVLADSVLKKWDEHYLGSMEKVSLYGKDHLFSFPSTDPLAAAHVDVELVEFITSATFIAEDGGDKTVEGGIYKIITNAGAPGDFVTIGATTGAPNEVFVRNDQGLPAGINAATVKAVAKISNIPQAMGLTLDLVDLKLVHDADKNNVEDFLADEYFTKEGRYVVEISMETVDAIQTTNGTVSTKVGDIFFTAGGGAVYAPTNRNLKAALNLQGETLPSDVKGCLTHFDLTGELLSDEVMDLIIDTSGAKLAIKEGFAPRRVNFAHQSATLAHEASTEYKTTMGIVPTTEPRGGRQEVARWAGVPPTYKVDSDGDLVVESTGKGFMGEDLFFGSASYRSGLAYGGLIHTNKGFGIDSTDEALDASGNPIDIGKHILICAAYGVVESSSRNRRNQRVLSSNLMKTNLGLKLIERLIELPPQEEPIGPVNGVLNGVSTTRARISRATLNDLALGRVCMIDEGGAISNLRTAALPSSDYTRVSTIRSANVVLDAMRNACLPFIGRSYSELEIASLDTELAGRMRALKADGIIQEGVVELRASRLDRINGKLNLKVTFIPPLSIEAISIDLAVEAPTAGV